MIGTLTDPWIAARLVAGITLCVLVTCAVALAPETRWGASRGGTSGACSSSDRSAALVAVLMEAAAVAAVTALALTLVLAERMTGSIRGALCGWGVVSSVEGGFVVVWTSLLTVVACALSLVVHRLDLRLHAHRLTRSKALASAIVAPLAWADLGATVRFVLALDRSVVASCCSTAVDPHVAALGATDVGPMRTLLACSALIAALVAAAAALWVRRTPRAAPAWTAAVSSLAAGGLGLAAVVYYVAPHAYRTLHLCPFCLLRSEVGGIGWPLFGSIVLGTVLGVGIGLVEGHRRAGVEPARTCAFERSLAPWVALAWTIAVVLAAVPVVRFALVSGGASLFGLDPG